MGMYDIICSEQVKVFPLVIYSDSIDSKFHFVNGNLRSFGIGSKVPYYSFTYNYSKNFIIFDSHCNIIEENIDFILHIITDGCVELSITSDDITPELQEKIDSYCNQNYKVISYFGDELNIHSIQDMRNFNLETLDVQNKRDILRKDWNEIFKEMTHTIYGIGAIDKNSEEYKERMSKFKTLQEQLHAEESKFEKEESELLSKHTNKWYIPENNIQNFGVWIESIYTLLEKYNNYKEQRDLDLLEKAKKEFNVFFKENINCLETYKDFIENDDTLINKMNQVLDFCEVERNNS